jgi:hypothetical protein
MGNLYGSAVLWRLRPSNIWRPVRSREIRKFAGGERRPMLNFQFNKLVTFCVALPSTSDHFHRGTRTRRRAAGVAAVAAAFPTSLQRYSRKLGSASK